MHYKNYYGQKYRPQKKRRCKDSMHHGYYNFKPYNLNGANLNFREKLWYILYYRNESSVATKQHKKWQHVFQRFLLTKSRVAKRLHRFKSRITL